MSPRAKPRPSAFDYDLGNMFPDGSGLNLGINATQTVHERDTIATQTVHKADTNATQENIENPITRHKRDTEGDTDRDTNATRTVHERDTELSFSRLLGIKRDVVKFVFNQCKFNGNLEGTEYLSYEHLSEAIGYKKSSMKTTVFRLREEGYLIRVDRVDGRGGLIRLKLNDSLYKTMLFSESSNLKREDNATRTRHERDTIRDTEGDTTLSSSSSIQEQSSKKTTTTKTELPDEWKLIDCSPLRELAEGFGESHLIRLFKTGKTTPEKVQESIKRIAFAVKYKTQTFKKTPIAMLMGLLADGNEFDPPKGYYSMILPREPEAINEEESDLPSTNAEATALADKKAKEEADEAKRDIADRYLKKLPSILT